MAKLKDVEDATDVKVANKREKKTAEETSRRAAMEDFLALHSFSVTLFTLGLHPFWIRNPVYVMDTGSHSFHVTISEVLRVPGLNCRGSTRQLTIIEMNESFDEIRNNSSAIFQFLQGGFVSMAAVSSPHQPCGWELLRVVLVGFIAIQNLYGPSY